MDNITMCQNVSLDLTASSIRYTLHPQLLVAIATAMCLVAAYIVGSNVFLILAVTYSGYHRKYINKTDRSAGISESMKIISISFYVIQLVIGAFCMPLSIVQVVGNGQWNLGPAFCTARIYVEAISEIISICHSVCICMDTYVMVSKPFKYRLLTSKTGYGMVLFSWVVPVIIFALVISLGWHTEDIREELYCLDAYNTCIPLISKKFLLFIIPMLLIIAICVITMAALVLIEIHKFHKKDNLQINILRRSNIKAEHFSNPNDDDSCICEKACTLNETMRDVDSKPKSVVVSKMPIHCGDSECSVSVIPDEFDKTTHAVSADNNTPKETGMAKAVSVNPKSNSELKAFGVVIMLAALQCVYILAFSAFASLFVFNTKMFPLWLVSCVSWLRYVHSALILAITFKHKPIGKLIRDFLKAF